MNEPDIDALVRAALAARENAYAPYSKFSVGAAIGAAEGRLFTGCNIENVSYGLTICAERVAINNAVSQGSRSFNAIAVATNRGVAPCGACLQVLAEFCQELTIVICDTDGKTVRTSTLSEMLPDRFSG